MDIHVNRWVLRAFVAVLLVGGGVGAGLALSGGDDGDSDGAASVATSEQDEINRTLIGQLVKREGFLGICLGLRVGGREEATRLGRETFGRLISSQGGDVKEVIDGLVKKCAFHV